MKTAALILLLCIPLVAAAQQTLTGGPGELYLLRNEKTRSVSPENFTGEKGKGGMATLQTGSAANAARELGQGWKVNPYVRIQPGQTFVMADIRGSGRINHIWMTPTGEYRHSIFRIYWDGEEEPSVASPVGDFFCSGWGWGNEPLINSLAVCVNPQNGFNCYWPMPYSKGFRITMENIGTRELIVYYQIDYCETDIPEGAARFHAQFRRTNPVSDLQDYTILDHVKGKGQYVGTYIAHGANGDGWWGEGEVKFFIDGDTRFPTICGTGEEDYFNGSYGYEESLDSKGKYSYTNFSNNYSGFHFIQDPGNRTKQRRFGEYRWHITDPVRFDSDLRVTIQCLGWQSGGRYLHLKEDMASVAYWYQTEPHHPFPAIPAAKDLAIRLSDPVNNLAKGAKVKLAVQPNPKYNPGPEALADGLCGTARFSDGHWTGFEGDDLDVTLELNQPVDVKKINVSFLSDQASWIFLPTQVEISVSSDGKTFRTIRTFNEPVEKEPKAELETFESELVGKSVKYIRVRADNPGTCPAWHAGAGEKCWIFADEIIVE